MLKEKQQSDLSFQNILFDGNNWYCEECGFGDVSPHSCKSKLCSSCATIAIKNWLAEVLPTLLDVKYFRIVFTLPPTLYPLFTANKKLLYNFFFRVASETLLLAAASLNFEPGIIIIFHPFGSEYNVRSPTRFYGIYANKKKKKLIPLAKSLAKAKGIKFPKKQSWRERKKKYSGKDPLLCRPFLNVTCVMMVLEAQELQRA